MVSSFRVRHHLPRIYHLTTKDPPPTYNYFLDTYGVAKLDTSNTNRNDGNNITSSEGYVHSKALAKMPPLGIAGDRKTMEMRDKESGRPLQAIERIRTDHKENLFESNAVGLGAAIDEERERVLATQKEKRV